MFFLFARPDYPITRKPFFSHPDLHTPSPRLSLFPSFHLFVTESLSHPVPYTNPNPNPNQVASHRGRLECARALLRAGADPNFINGKGDLVIFWAIDGGPECIQLFHEYGCDFDAVSPLGWTPLSYCIAKGKYGATEEKGIYPEDVLRYYGATQV